MNASANLPSTTCSPTRRWPAIRSPSCSTATGSTRRPCRRSRASSTCRRRSSSCRRDNPAHRARVRIFTPNYEMPFAGHPTVGSAIAHRRERPAAATAGMFVLEENIGPVRCAVTKGADGDASPSSTCRSCPSRWHSPAMRRRSARHSASTAHEIGFENHSSGLWSGGVPYVTVPVAGLDAAAKASFDNAGLDGADRPGRGAVARRLCLLPRDGAARQRLPCAHVRAGHSASYEDPATGSAAAAFAGAIMHFDRPVDGVSRYLDRAGHGDGPAVADPAGDRRRGGSAGRRAHRRPCGQGGRRRAVRLRPCWAANASAGRNACPARAGQGDGRVYIAPVAAGGVGA